MDVTDKFLEIPNDLNAMAKFTSQNINNTIKINHNIINICDLEGTMLFDNDDLDTWQEVYLPKPVKMEIIGIKENLCAPTIDYLHWVILLGKDHKIYGYLSEKLYILANNKHELVLNGIKTDVYFNYPIFRYNEND